MKFSSCAVGASWKGKGYTPSAGDFIFFDWNKDGQVDHVGIVVNVANGRVNTIEGNTSNMVARRSNMKKRINPISYLGWLGIVGVIGINTGDFMLQLFLIYFIFFTYRNMPADELFWLNIRKSATRAFILEIILNSVMIILITILEKYNISSAIRISIIRGFGIIFLIALLFFIVMLAWYGKQERKSVEDIYDNNKY